MFPSNVHINILRGLPCRLESLRLKFTNEPSIFVDGDLDESIRRSASDRLGDLVPQVRARTSPGVFRDMALLGLCLELSFNVLYCRTQANLPTLFYTMVEKSQKWPKTQIKGGSCLKLLDCMVKRRALCQAWAGSVIYKCIIIGFQVCRNEQKPRDGCSCSQLPSVSKNIMMVLTHRTVFVETKSL